MLFLSLTLFTAREAKQDCLSSTEFLKASSTEWHLTLGLETQKKTVTWSYSICNRALYRHHMRARTSILPWQSRIEIPRYRQWIDIHLEICIDKLRPCPTIGGKGMLLSLLDLKSLNKIEKKKTQPGIICTLMAILNQQLSLAPVPSMTVMKRTLSSKVSIAYLTTNISDKMENIFLHQVRIFHLNCFMLRFKKSVYTNDNEHWKLVSRQ